LATRIIDRYICREVFSHALLGLAVFTFVFFIQPLVRLMDLIVRHSGDSVKIFELFLCTFPEVLTFTLPIAILVGVLIGLGRMSADSELIAMNALGMGLRRLMVPVGFFATAGFGLTLAMTLWLGPLSISTLRSLEDVILASSATSQVEPRIFDERFPNLVLYIQDVSAAATHWHGIFLAQSGTDNDSNLTLAEDAIVIVDPQQGKLELHFRDGTTHQVSMKDPSHYNLSVFGQRDFTFATKSNAIQNRRDTVVAERSLHTLLTTQGPDWREARVEFHRRFAFPVACLVFALVAVPLASRPRRGGRAAGFLLAILLIGGYYILFVVGAGMARGGSLPPWLGMWAADIGIGLGGIALLPGMTRIQGDSKIGPFFHALIDWRRRLPHRKGRANNNPAQQASRAPLANGAENETANGLGPERTESAESAVRPSTLLTMRRRRTGGGFPQFLDYYVLRNFLLYFAVLLVGFILIYDALTFFDLLSDISDHHTTLIEVMNYFRYVSYFEFYELAPLACLISVLVTLSIMTKNNEIVAFKAAGISVYRLAIPLLVVGTLFAGGLFVIDYTYLPYVNQRQDELRNMIKGHPPHTYYEPTRQWIFGDGSKIYNYQLFDPDHNLFGGLNILELDPQTFALRRRVYAERARWEPVQKTWVLESGWLRDFDSDHVTRFVSFPVMELAELDEPPSYFNREIRQSSEMNWFELRRYITDLSHAGFDVARLSVELQKKLAFPLMAPIIILLAVPFSILVGSRGAIGGVALGVGIGVFYWAMSALLEAMGAAGQLPPSLAAWAPDAGFFFLGIYFFLKMQT
jgi:LPS export ABC transporter permease LptF/LPS export ABC transporter permease LptG